MHLKEKRPGVLWTVIFIAASSLIYTVGIIRALNTVAYPAAFWIETKKPLSAAAGGAADIATLFLLKKIVKLRSKLLSNMQEYINMPQGIHQVFGL